MKIEKLKQLSHITLGDMIEFAPIMKLPLKEAKPKISKFMEKHKLNSDQVRNVCSIVKTLGLYTY